MNSYVKNTWKSRTLLSVLSVVFVLVVACILIAPAVSKRGAELFNAEADEILLEQQFISHDDEIMLMALSKKALQLKSPDNIESITLSYKDQGEWVEITEENSSALSAGTSYQLKIVYAHINAAELLAADCQMVYETLPDWFSPNDTGVLLHGDEVVADIEVKNGRVIATFKEDWLREQGDKILHGSFKVNGEIEWHNLPADGGEAAPIPGLSFGLEFEDDLASRYGNLKVEKLEPELVEREDGYFLKYEIEVTSLEAETSLPDIYIIDTFTSNVAYVEGYVGVTGDLTEPLDLYPKEKSTEELSGDAQLKMEGQSMRWDIGELKPGEVRLLVYYAKVRSSYITSILNSEFKNMAEVFSGEFPRDSDSSRFAPKKAVEAKKTLIDSEIDTTGTGELRYKITVSAPKSNSYTLKDLTVRDAFAEHFNSFLEIKSISVDGEEIPAEGPPFEIKGITLAPGDVITIEYTVKAEYLFTAYNGDIELNNAVRISSKDGKNLGSAVHTELFKQSSWMRKIHGDQLERAETIEIPSTDSVYDTDKQAIENDGSLSFVAPKGSLRYQVVLNEDGRWDLSTATLKDSFEDMYMRYCGYVQIKVYAKPETVSDEPLGNDELLEELGNKEAIKTVWLKADELNGFAFSPQELGLPEGEYTYLLTYYAKPEGVDNMGAFTASNSFEISGNVGLGNGKYTSIPPMRLTVSSVMKGGIDYDIEKIGWYYELAPVYRTVDESIYSDEDLKKDYPNGAVYWVIRLEGDIREGWLSVSSGSKVLNGFVIKDVPSDGAARLPFNRTSVVGAYVASNKLDFSNYESYEDFILKGDYTKKLKGNPQNDKYFPNTAVPNADYEWYSENNAMDGIVFPNGYKLNEGEAIYIVIRTVPEGKPTATVTYSNKVSVRDNTETEFEEIDTAELTVTYALFKESKGAYIYDADKNKYENCSPSYTGAGDDWKPSSLDWDYIRENCGSGIYAPWLLNVNYNGTMEGTADVSDILPEGMELAFCDINWIGKDARDPYSTCEEIPELDNDDDWIRFEKVNTVDATHIGFGTAITYYNPTTRELRWRISNLKKYPDGPGSVGYDVNLRIVCKVTDHDLLLRRGNKTYFNYAYSGDEIDRAYVTIRSDGSMSKQVWNNGTIDEDNAGNIQNDTRNRLPFSIVVNRFSEDLCDGDTLPALIDELSSGLVLVEDSLRIVDDEENPIKNYSYTIREEDGRQTIIIKGLPDNKKFTIYYETRISAQPGEKVTGISNNAYWDGYPSNEPQVGNKSFTYKVDGNIFSSEPISIVITKVDSIDHMQRLEDAEFEIWTVDAEGKPEECVMSLAPTDSEGQTGVERTNDLKYNTVYCIVETVAPEGYKLEETPHYFVVVRDSNDFDLSGYDADIAKLVDIWYDSPIYQYTMPNGKDPISVNKVFQNVDGSEFIPTSGTYRFGLYETRNARNPVEILKIVYTESGPKYYLDDFESDGPYFTKYDPMETYYVYELDSKGAPIKNNESGEIHGITYHVNYYDSKGKSSNSATINSTVKIVNIVGYNLTEMVSTGGSGLKKYYLAGGALLLMSAAAFVFLLSSKEKRAENA